MGGNIFSYVQHLELLAFFSGYPLVYYLVRVFIRNGSLKNSGKAGMVSALPYAYALMGTLYFGLQLKNLYPAYTVENLSRRIQQPYLMIWGLLSVLFWIPGLSKKQLLSFLHSLVFFFVIVKDLFFQLTGFISDQNLLKNDMKIYTFSIFLNLASFLFIMLLSFLPPFRIKSRKS